MPRTVSAVRINQFGGPEVLEIIQTEIADPGPDEIVVDVEWIGLNRAEILWRQGEYLVKPDLPAPIGLECSGIVAEVGDAVRGVAPGDRVGVVPARFDVLKYGTYSNSILMPAAAVVPTPSNVEGAGTAAVWMAFLTAWGGLLDVGGLEEGWHVVIPAASSSVGLAAIQLCEHEGAIPIALTTSKSKVEALQEQGAAHVILSNEEDVTDRVREITEGRGAQLFFDPVGGPLVARELRCAAPGARVVLYGLLDRAPAELDIASMIARGLRVEGYMLGRTTLDPQVFDVAVGQITDAINEDELEPIVDRVFAFSEIQEAHRYVESGKQIGKVVVEVS